MNAPAAAREVLELAEVLRPALLRVSRRLRQESQRAGASPLDAQILGAIKKHPAMGVSDLAAHEQMTRPSMSAHLKRLETAGWIGRGEAPGEDRRRVGLRLTAAGTRALEAIRRRRNDWLAARLSTLSPAERAALEAAAGPLLRLAGDQ